MVDCICPECPNHNWNPWSPNKLTPEEAIDVHNDMFHDGEPVAHLTTES
jgi:hypothetical protein